MEILAYEYNSSEATEFGVELVVVGTVVERTPREPRTSREVLKIAKMTKTTNARANLDKKTRMPHSIPICFAQNCWE